MRRIRCLSARIGETTFANIYGHNLVAFGDFRAAQQILALDPVGSSLRLTLSRFFQAESVKTDNLILIGGKKANPWIYIFDDQTTFSLDYDDVRGLGYIANRHPRPGEAASYTPSRYPIGFVGYSVVAYMPNPSHIGNVIIIAGTDSDSTSAAAEFLTSEEQLGKFRKTTEPTPVLNKNPLSRQIVVCAGKWPTSLPAE